ncbi:adhesin, partial [Stenotrophomonas pavanii]|uniref:adhesin n=1 Tax=Stenotrophomonas pavanii TaxID=487698 RepID=UPI002ACD3E07
LLPINTSVIAINYGNRMSTKGWPVQLYPRTARAEMRRTGEDAWRPYNVILEEITPGAIGLSIGQGEQRSVLFDGDGLFLPGRSSAGEEYSMVVRDAAGCEHRSVTFIP